MANVHNFIVSMGEKYETRLGKYGVLLSDEQGQRISIARALIRNPKIILFEETFGNRSEQLLDIFEKAKSDRTIIIFSQRLAKIENADLIVMVDGGQCKESNTHDELMEKRGLYYDMINQSDAIHKDKKSSEEKCRNEDSKPTCKKKQKSSCETRNVFKYELKLLRFLRKDKSLILVGVVSQALYGTLFPLICVFFSEIYTIFTTAESGEQQRASFIYMGVILGLGLLSSAASFVQNYSFNLAQVQLMSRLRLGMFESMLRQEIGFHDSESNKPCILLNKLAHSVPLCKGISLDRLSLLVQGAAGIVFSLTYAFYIDWKLSLVILAFVPINFMATLYMGKRKNESRELNSTTESIKVSV